MNTFLTDVRYGLRLLLKTPGFALIAVLALALGIGANTAIFSVVDAAIIRPLPYADPDRLMVVWEDASFAGFPKNTPAPANYVDWKQQNQVFTDMAATRFRATSLTGDGPPQMAIGLGVTANRFSVLGVKPVLGRTFTEAEDQSGQRLVVLSNGLWQSRYGGDPGLVGRSIQMDGANVTVLGIMPRDFNYPRRNAEFWVPINFSAKDWNNRGSHFLMVIARLKPGLSVARARSDMDMIAKRLQERYPNSNKRVGAVVEPLKEQVLGDTRIALMVLLAAAGCVLLIACANVANLLLAKAAAREREMAIRTALGAGRGRLVRQMLTESLLLSLAGGAFGLALARLGIRVLEVLIPVGVPAGSGLAIDSRLLAFNLAVSLLTGILFGLAPALQTTGRGVSEKLKQGGRGGFGVGHRRFRDALVVAEVALAMLLLVSASLLIQTVANLRSVEIGFRIDHLLTMTTRLPMPKYADASKRIGYFDAVLAKVRALPGVVSASFTSNLPFTARGNTNGYRVEGKPLGAGDPGDALYREVTDDYLQTMGVRLLTGRFFGNGDRLNSLPVVIINETFRKMYWPNESPLGKRISTANNRMETIVGVIADIKERGLDVEMKPAVYLPVAQVPLSWNLPSSLAIRTAVDPSSLVKPVREAIWSVDRDQPISEVLTMEDIADLQVAKRKQQTMLLGSFAALALILACLGIYGVLSYAVTQRTREIGVRMALGANTGNVMRMVAGQGLGLTGFGLVIGFATALAATRSMSALLYGVKAGDPKTYALVSVVLAAVAIFACFVPANRASRVDPVVALRDE